MSERGWYPDPEGTPERLRHWDGHAWSAETRPQGGARAPRNRQRHARVFPWGVVLGVIVATLLVAFVAATVAVNVRPTASATPEDHPTPSLPASNLCRSANDFERPNYPKDQFAYGGGLRLPRPAGWRATGSSSQLWLRQAGQLESPESGGRTMIDVGRVERERFGGRDAALAAVTECFAQWDGDPRLHDISDTDTTIAGAPARIRRVRVNIEARIDGTDWVRMEVAVIDLGDPETWSVFAIRSQEPQLASWDAAVGIRNQATRSPI